MKNKFLLNFILIIIFSFCSVFFVACDGDNEANDNEKPIEEQIIDEDENAIAFTSICPSFFSENGLYEIEYKYSDNYFKNSSYLFSKNLANLSLGLSVVNRETDGKPMTTEDYYLRKYFNAIGFDNIYFSSDYFVRPTKDTLTYSFGHKKIDDFDVIAIAISGIYGYGSEWANNFLMSNSGHHKGFYDNANRVFADLKEYVKNNNYDEGCTKIWATGYSRGAGITNLFGVVINDDIDAENELNLEKSNVFIYTFGTPQGVSDSYDKEINYVHNIINNQDIVTELAPSQYGFKRAGIDYDVGSKDVYQILKDYDSAITVEEFYEKSFVYSSEGISLVVAKNPYTDASILFDRFYEKLLKDFNDKNISMSTRELYSKNFEATVCGILDYTRNLSNRVMSSVIQNAVAKFNSSTLKSLLSNEEDLLYNIVKESLDDVGLVFNNENLKTYSTAIQNLLHTLIMKTPSITNEFATVAGNLSYLGVMHDAITTYLLLQRY